MKDKILNLFVYPGLAIIFCLAFGMPFVYAGFQSVHVRGTRNQSGSVIINVDRSHYFGLIHKRFQVEDVLEARWVNTRIRQSGKARSTVSGVGLISDTEQVPIFFGSSDMNEALKWKAINDINSFIDSSQIGVFSETYKIRNAFGWFGLPFLVLGIGGSLAWPSSILKGWRD